MNDRPNPPKVIGSWDDVELPLGYGFGARVEFGNAHAVWTRELEDKLKREWEAGSSKTGRPWTDVREQVKRGYEYR